MRRIGILAMALSICTTPIFAQDGPDEMKKKKEEMQALSPQEKAEKHTAKLTEMLGLSEQQAKEIQVINLKHTIEMDKIKAEQKALKERAKAQRKKTDEDIVAVLTEEQKKVFNEKKAEHQKKRAEKHKENCGHHH